MDKSFWALVLRLAEKVYSYAKEKFISFIINGTFVQNMHWDFNEWREAGYFRTLYWNLQLFFSTFLHLTCSLSDLQVLIIYLMDLLLPKSLNFYIYYVASRFLAHETTFWFSFYLYSALKHEKHCLFIWRLYKIYQRTAGLLFLLWLSYT